MYSGWVGDDDSSFLGLRACAHKVTKLFDCLRLDFLADNFILSVSDIVVIGNF